MARGKNSHIKGHSQDRTRTVAVVEVEVPPVPDYFSATLHGFDPAHPKEQHPLAVNGGIAKRGRIISQKASVESTASHSETETRDCGVRHAESHGSVSAASEVDLMNLILKEGMLARLQIVMKPVQMERQTRGSDSCPPRSAGTSSSKGGVTGNVLFSLADKDCVADKARTPTGWQVESRCRRTNDSGLVEIRTTSVRIDVGDGVPDAVAIDGCADLAAQQESTQLTAIGKPGGGRYRWTVEPSSAIALSASGEKASLTCRAPGKGTISVEYTPPGGKAAPMRSTKEASCTRLTAVNGGRPVPKLGLYDAEGALRSPVVEVPLTVEPADGGSKLTFKPANEALLSAVGLSNKVQLQGVKEGTTMVVPQTSCGKEAGPKFQVQVVPCDDEVIEELRRRERTIKARLDSNRRQQNALVSDDEFDRAAREVRDDTIDMAVKTSELIAKTMTKTGRADTALVDAEKFVGNLKLVSNVVTGRTDKATVTLLLKKSGFLSTFKAATDAAVAAKKFAQDLGTLVGTADRLAELENQEIETEDELRRISYRLHERCKAGGSQREERATQRPDAPSEPKTAGTKPSASDPVRAQKGSSQTVSTAVSEASSPSQPVGSTADAGTPAVYGAPLQRQGSGGGSICQAPSAEIAGRAMRSVAEQMRNVQAASNRWSDQTLAEFKSALDRLGVVLSRYEQANELGEPERSAAFRELRKELNPLLRGIDHFGRKTEAFNASLNGCQDYLAGQVSAMRQSRTH